MGRAFGLISVILVVAVGGYMYTRQAQSVTTMGTTPKTTVDVLAVRNDLMAIANAEKRYWVTNSKYASLDDLRTGGDIEVPSRQLRVLRRSERSRLQDHRQLFRI